MTILKTRLFRPTINKGILRRERLTVGLERDSHKSLILVVAAAGYGKSVAVSQWLDEYKGEYCWLSLEQDCNDLNLFLEYLAASVKTTFPESLSQFSQLLNALEYPPVKEIANILINDLSKLSREVKIVLDDYHLIKNQDIHTLLHDLLHFAPKGVGFVVLTRHDLPLRLGALKAYEVVSEIRMDTLRFTEKEIVEYARIHFNQIVSDETAGIISRTTEGWILGIHLLIREMQKGKNILESIKTLQGDNNLLSDFLMEEIFMDLEDVVKDGLMICSLFDRFNLDMLYKLSELNLKNKEDGSENRSNQIRDFLNSSLFVIPLDTRSSWFRFHHLVQQHMRSRATAYFTEAEIMDLYGLGADYFESLSFFEEAIKYSIKGKKFTKAIDLIDNNWNELLLRDQYGRLQRWIGLVPEGLSHFFPRLLIIQTILNDAHSHYSEMAKHLDRFLIIMDPLDLNLERSRTLWGEYFALRAGLNYFTGKIDQVIENADRALDLLSDSSSYFLDYATVFKAFVLHISKKESEAVGTFKIRQRTIESSNVLGFMRSHSFLNLIYIYQANLNSIKNSADLVFRISEEEEAWVSFVMANKFLASVYYYQNDLDKVSSFVKNVSNHRLGGRPLWVAHALFMGVLKSLALGEYKKMHRDAAELTSYLKSFRMQNFDDLAYSMEVELAVRLKNLKNAEVNARKTKFESIPIIFSFYFTQLTRVKLLMLRGDAGSMNSAFNLLTQHEEDGRMSNNRNFLIQVYALFSIWYYQNGGMVKAIEYLQQSLDLSRNGEYIRVYLDLGNSMQVLLSQLTARGDEDNYAARILGAFKNEKSTENNDAINRIQTQSLPSGDELTPKEIAILELVSHGLHNKEIADELCISTETVKKYLYYAYNKLGVQNRTSAVSRAIQLDLIPSPSTKF